MDNKMDDKTHTKHTANTENQLNIPVDELKLGADDASTLATEETSAKYLVYIMNIPEGKLGTIKMYKIPVRTQANRMTRNLVL